MPALSVIIPIYKAEKYIKQCVESILNQTFTDFELILVDDGSPDACAEICDVFAEKDSRVRVIHKENGGAQSARKNGLERAKGRYISFIDADDWIDTDMYSYLFDEYLKYDPDIMITGYISEEGGQSKILQNAFLSGVYCDSSVNQLKENAIYSGDYYIPGIIPALWNKVIKREIIQKILPFVDDRIALGEDAAVSYPAIACSKCVVIDNEFHPYHYRVLPNSMSKVFKSSFFTDSSILLSWLKDRFTEYEENKMLFALNYYSVFLVDLGLTNMIMTCPKRSLWSVGRKIKKVIESFQLPVMIRQFRKEDGFSDCDWKEISALGNSQIERYVLYKIKRALKSKVQLWIK